MNGSELGLTGYDDLFETDESREIKKQPKVVKLSIEEIADFPEHPFKVNDDDKMKETVESIKENGVLVPAIVRQEKICGPASRIKRNTLYSTGAYGRSGNSHHGRQ